MKRKDRNTVWVIWVHLLLAKFTSKCSYDKMKYFIFRFILLVAPAPALFLSLSLDLARSLSSHDGEEYRKSSKKRMRNL